MKRIASLILAAALVVALCACGSKDNPRVGVYKATSMTQDGMDLIQMMQSLGQEFNIYLVLNSDGTGSMEMDGDKTDLKWDDASISDPSGEEGSLPYTYSDGTITLEEDGATIVFVKLAGDELAAYQKNAG